jgi:hypothetical protein
MQSYSCALAGIPHERRARYIANQVHVGASLTLRREPDETYGPEAIAVYHERRKIGFIPAEERWAWQSLADGERNEATVQELTFAGDGAVSGVNITVNVLAGDAPPIAVSELNPVVVAIGDELKILGAVASASGQFSKTERKLIAKYAEVRCGELAIGAAAEEIVASMRWLKHNLPDDRGLASAIARLKRPDAFEAMLEVSEIIAEAEGAIGTEEQTAVARIRSLIAERRAAAA